MKLDKRLEEIDKAHKILLERTENDIEREKIKIIHEQTRVAYIRGWIECSRYRDWLLGGQEDI